MYFRYSDSTPLLVTVIAVLQVVTLLPSVHVAVIVTSPHANNVISPVSSTVAIVSSLDA